MTSKSLDDYTLIERPKPAMAYAKGIFRDVGLHPLPDGELADLVATSAQYLKREDLLKFLTAQQRFDGPVTMMETGEKVEHHGLRQSLQEIPDYVQSAAQAGLTYRQANDILMHFFKSEPYDFHQENITINLLGRAYRQTANSGSNLPQHSKVFKDAVALCAKEGIIDGFLYAFSIATRLGLISRTSL